MTETTKRVTHFMNFEFQALISSPPQNIYKNQLSVSPSQSSKYKITKNFLK